MNYCKYFTQMENSFYIKLFECKSASNTSYYYYIIIDDNPQFILAPNYGNYATKEGIMVHNFKSEEISHRFYRDLKNQNLTNKLGISELTDTILEFVRINIRIHDRTKYNEFYVYNEKKLANDQLDTLKEIILEAFNVFKSNQFGKHSDNNLKEEINVLKSEISFLNEKIAKLSAECLIRFDDDEKFKKIKDIFGIDKLISENNELREQIKKLDDIKKILQT